MTGHSDYSYILDHFRHQAFIRIAAGTTCAYQGDERGLREFLVADEAARHLASAGHTAFFYLIDDSLDPLNIRQMRVAFQKDEAAIEKHKEWCGRPIADLPDPWGCHESFAAHFESRLLDQLHRMGCHPTLISTAKLYERGLYAPFIRQVLEREAEFRAYLAERFPDYHPEKLFWVICPGCGYIDSTRIERTGGGAVTFYCERCERETSQSLEEVRGKLNWKIDCAARWKFLSIDAEPFTKAYLEPQTGTFAVSSAICRDWFDGPAVFPLHYGQVKMDRHCSYRLARSLPKDALRALYTEHPAVDLHLTRDLIVTLASRHQVDGDLSYLDFVKQMLPIWMLTPDRLNDDQRDLLSRGISFIQNFTDSKLGLRLPSREVIEIEDPLVLERLRTIIRDALALRGCASPTYEEFQSAVKPVIDGLGTQKRSVLRRFRSLVGQPEGLPVVRILYLLPVDYLRMLEYVLDLHLITTQAPALALQTTA